MDNAQFGNGEHAALLIHGLSGSPLEMRYVAGRLRKAGFSVHVPHLAGYGFADRGKRTDVGHWQDWYRELANEFEELSRAHRTVSVCGLCIGAVLALKLAADTGARISGLSLLATTLFYDGWSIPWYRFLLTLGYYIPFGHGYAYQERYPYGVKNEQLRRWIAREMREKSTSIAGASQLSLTAIHEAEKLIGVVKRRMREVTVPALVIHALEDDVASVRSAEFVEKHIGARDVRSVRLADSYHMLTIDNEKRRVADETIAFFSECSMRQAHTPVASGATHVSPAAAHVVLNRA